jgi:hypothetical protein
VAAELEVFRLVHHAHAPAADPAEDSVMGNRLTHGLGRRGHWLDMLGGSKGEVNPSRNRHHQSEAIPLSTPLAVVSMLEQDCRAVSEIRYTDFSARPAFPNYHARSQTETF